MLWVQNSRGERPSRPQPSHRCSQDSKTWASSSGAAQPMIDVARRSRSAREASRCWTQLSAYFGGSSPYSFLTFRSQKQVP
jgi:hypothetical protein